jgi:hypothetical protein
MQSLIRQLSSIGSETKQLVQVIAYFDHLISRSASVDDLARAAAALSGCAAGINLGDGVLRRWSPKGLWLGSGPPSETLISRPIKMGQDHVGHAWLEGTENKHALHDMIIERFAISVAAIWRQVGSSPTPRSTLDRLIEAQPSENIEHLLESLGVPADTSRGRMVAIRGEAETDSADVMAFALALSSRAGFSDEGPVQRAGIWVALAREEFDEVEALETVNAVPFQMRIGLGDIVSIRDLARSLATATACLAFTTTASRIVNAHQLGALTLIAWIPPTVIKEHPDISALLKVRDSRRGEDLITTLEDFARGSSLREIGDHMHLHHSTVAERLAKAEQILGWKIDSGDMRGRLSVGLLMLRTLSQSETKSSPMLTEN